METTNNQIDFSKLSESFQSLIRNPELTFKIFDMLPTPIEIFGADGLPPSTHIALAVSVGAAT